MVRYINPLHLPIPVSHFSNYSTLTGAIPASLIDSETLRFSDPKRRWLPQDIYPGPNAKHHIAPGGLYPSITFDYIGSSNQGVPMRELIARSANALASMIQDAYDPVFSQTGQETITFCIFWPGYTHVEWKQTIDVTDYAPMTRAQLGASLSRSFSQYIERARRECYTGSAEWNVGDGSVKFDQLMLVSFSNITDNVWQANVAVDV